MERKDTSLCGKKYKIMVSDTGIAKRVCFAWPNKWKENICALWSAKTTPSWQVYRQVHFLDKKYLIHRLVANAFLWLDLKNSSILVCHKDDNPENCNVNNLFLWNHKSNSYDRFRFKITKESISVIRKMIKKWYTDDIIFNKFYEKTFSSGII